MIRKIFPQIINSDQTSYTKKKYIGENIYLKRRDRFYTIT